MVELFSDIFLTTFGAVGRIFLIILAAGILVHKKIITEKQVKALSQITVNILLPCMLFSKISTGFQPGAFNYWWAIPLSSIVMIFIGVLFGYLFYARSYRQKQFLIPLASMQNAVYLVLPIGMFLYPDQFDRFTVYNFLFLIGFMPVVWSLGKVLITGSSFKTVKLKEFLTPPLITAFSTLLIVFTGLNRYIPNLFMDSVELVGEATIPISNIVLGATLGGISFRVLPDFSDLLKLNVIKYMLMPLSVIGVMYLLGLKEHNPLLANMLVIESAAAPATALILQVRAYGGDRQTVGSLMLLSYILCLLAIPFWMAIWQLI